MIITCKNCGGSTEWKPGDPESVCKVCKTKLAIEKKDIYEQASRLALEDSEESLEQALQLFCVIRGYKDTNKRYIDCRTRLGQMRWKEESAWLKEEERRFEAKMARRKTIALSLLLVVLFSFTVVSAVSLVRFRQYCKAVEYFTTGEYGRSAAAFQKLGDYRDSKAKVYMSAVELYKSKRYEEAIPYFIWLDGYIDNGYHLQRYQERMAEQGAVSNNSE